MRRELISGGTSDKIKQLLPLLRQIAQGFKPNQEAYKKSQ
jgi:hypothetical protein